MNNIVPHAPYERSIAEMKNIRNNLLKESDWTAIPDANPKPSKEAWLIYRQALRDLPQNFEDPSEVIWPQKPE
jgi:hypothetical protein